MVTDDTDQGKKDSIRDHPWLSVFIRGQNRGTGDPALLENLGGNARFEEIGAQCGKSQDETDIKPLSARFHFFL